MFQRIFIIFLIAFLAVSFSDPAPTIAQAVPAQEVTDQAQPKGFLQTIENASGFASNRIVAAVTHIPNIPNEIGRAFNQLTAGFGFPRFLGMLIIILALLAASFGVEIFFKRHITGFYRQVESIPRLGEIQKFWSAILMIVTDFLGLFIFTLFSRILFLLIYGAGRSSARLIFIQRLGVGPQL